MWLLPAALVGVAAFIVPRVAGHSLPAVLGTVVLLFLVQTTCFYGMWRVRRDLLRRLREAGGRLCPGCEFDLRGLGDSGSCPECGRPFEIDAVRAQWRSFIGFGYTWLGGKWD